jgi:hypothetical protein
MVALEQAIQESVTVNDLVARFLIGRRGIDFCDACLAEVLRVADPVAGEAASGLATRPEFLRDLWDCRRCSRRTKVTRALVRHVRKPVRGGAAA